MLKNFDMCNRLKLIYHIPYYNLLTFTSRLYFSKFSMRKSQLMPHFNFVVMHNTHCQWLATCRFSPCTKCTLVSFTNKTDCHDIAEILLKVALNTTNQPTNHILWNLTKNNLWHLTCLILLHFWMKKKYFDFVGLQ